MTRDKQKMEKQQRKMGGREGAEQLIVSDRERRGDDGRTSWTAISSDVLESPKLIRPNSWNAHETGTQINENRPINGVIKTAKHRNSFQIDTILRVGLWINERGESWLSQ